MSDDILKLVELTEEEAAAQWASFRVNMHCRDDHGNLRCPLCGKFAKIEELGSLGGPLYRDGAKIGHISAFGHLPGFGCNKS